MEVASVRRWCPTWLQPLFRDLHGQMSPRHLYYFAVCGRGSTGPLGARAAHVLDVCLRSDSCWSPWRAARQHLAVGQVTGSRNGRLSYSTRLCCTAVVLYFACDTTFMRARRSLVDATGRIPQTLLKVSGRTPLQVEKWGRGRGGSGLFEVFVCNVPALL